MIITILMTNYQVFELLMTNYQVLYYYLLMIYDQVIKLLFNYRWVDILVR